jgi:G3E family GTPase
MSRPNPSPAGPLAGPPARLPAIVVAGYLGAGKTTALEALVRGLLPERAAWVIQDVSGLHDDGLTYNAAWQRIAARLPETGGCLGCALRADLLAEVGAVVDRTDVDVLVVEVPGILDAAHVPRCLATDEQLARAVEVRAVVTVVDAATFVADLHDAGPSHPNCGGDRSLAELRLCQVEQADVLVVAGGTQPELSRVVPLLGRLRPGAPILRENEVRAAAARLLARGCGADRGTGSPSPGSPSPGSPSPGSPSPGTAQPLDPANPCGGRDGGVGTLRYTADRPFHPQRLAETLAAPLPGVLRGRGRAWVASHPEVAVAWEQSVAALELEPEGTWPGRAAVALEVIGIDLDAGALRATLDRCLLTDAELAAGPAAWAALPHPFPTWDVDELDVLPDPSTPGGSA